MHGAVGRFAGLGRMQAINRIRQREAILRDRRLATLQPVEDVQFEQLPTVMRYANDPAFRSASDAETQANRNLANAAFDKSRDVALAKLGYI